MTLQVCLLLATLLFSVGVFGLLTRRHAIATLLSVEVMANAANLAFVSFAYFVGGAGHIAVLFGLAITVAEVAVGLALIMLMHRRYHDTLLDLARDAKFVPAVETAPVSAAHEAH